MTAMFELDGRIYTHEELAPLLPEARASGKRVLCRCMPGGCPMYVSRNGDGYEIKRMPNTGPTHRPSCKSYEPDLEVSGRGELADAIHEEPGRSEVRVALSFGLRLLPPRGARPVRTEPLPDEEDNEVRAKRRKCDLPALLDLLCDEAGLNRRLEAGAQRLIPWDALERAVSRITAANGTSLESVTYAARHQAADSDKSRRRTKLAFIRPDADGTRPVALVVGEFLRTEDVGAHVRVTLKQMRGAEFLLAKRKWETLANRNKASLASYKGNWPYEQRPRLLCLLAISWVKVTDEVEVYEIHGMAMRLTTRHWIPIDRPAHVALIEWLDREQRSYLRLLHFGLKDAWRFPDVVVLDAGDKPCYVLLMEPWLTDEQREKKRALVEKRSEPFVIVDDGQDKPPLPPKEYRLFEPQR